MRYLIGAALVAGLIASEAFGGQIEQGGVKAVNVNPHAVRVTYNGRELGVFGKEAMGNLLKGLRAANGLIKRMSQKELREALEKDPSIKARIEALEAGN